MIEKLAIVALVLLNQLNIIPENQNKSNLLSTLIKKESIYGNLDFQERNWIYYKSNLDLEEILQPLPYKINGALDASVDAKAAIVLDAGTNAVLYSKNSSGKLPIASLTKIMTALVVLDSADFKDTVTVSEKAYSVDKKKNGLVAGEKINAGNLFKMMLIESNNVAAMALAEHVSGGDTDRFIELMNRKAELLGLKDTHFSNPDGLDDKNNYSTAYDMAQLADYALEKPLIWDIVRIQKLTITSSDGKAEHKIKSTNLLLGKLENIVGGKTGFTDEAGECLALVVENKEGHKIISVVLGAKDRFTETDKLVKWVFENYRW